MSIDPTFSSDTTKFRRDDVPLPRATPPRSAGGEVSPDLVDQTKNQIRALVQEIADLAKTEISEADFYQGFLTRVTSALASAGGVLWSRDQANQPLTIQYHINLKQTVLADDPQAQVQHSRLLEQICQQGEPQLVPPHSGAEAPEGAANPTPFLLIFGPIRLENQVLAVVEVLQRPGGGPATQRGYLRFVNQMCEIASDFLKTRRLQAFQQQQALWTDLDQFSKLIHASLDPEPTAFAIVNEGRRIIGCERVSLAVRQGPRYVISAVSGLDTQERRSEQLQKLSRLAAAVAKTKQALWYNGDDSQLPPQIDKALQSYLDSSHTKSLALLPLNTAAEPAAAAAPTTPADALLILEHTLAPSENHPWERRAELVAEHAGQAWGNVSEHQGIFLLPVWKRLGMLTAPFRGTRLPRSLSILTALALSILFLCLCPYSFQLGATGELTPETQQEIFAQVDGRLIEISAPTDPYEIVPAGAELARMESIDLSVTIEALEGQVSQTEKLIEKYRRELTRNQLVDLERIKAEGESFKAETELNHLRRELALRHQEAEKLTVRSPIAGQVVNWQVRRNLLGRPVTKGQHLMTIVAPDTDWQVVLHVPEKRMGHLLAAQAESPQPLTVTFTLASHPGETYTGEVVQIDRVLDVYDDQQNGGRVLVNFPNQQIPRELLRSGTRTTAKVDCGTRSLGFVLFHEVYESIKASVLFWF